MGPPIWNNAFTSSPHHHIIISIIWTFLLLQFMHFKTWPISSPWSHVCTLSFHHTWIPCSQLVICYFQNTLEWASTKRNTLFSALIDKQRLLNEQDYQYFFLVMYIFLWVNTCYDTMYHTNYLYSPIST